MGLEQGQNKEEKTRGGWKVGGTQTQHHNNKTVSVNGSGIRKHEWFNSRSEHVDVIVSNIEETSQSG